MRKKKAGGASKAFLAALAKSRKPAGKAKTEGPAISPGESAYWAEVVDAMANKKTPPRRPRG